MSNKKNIFKYFRVLNFIKCPHSKRHIINATWYALPRQENHRRKSRMLIKIAIVRRPEAEIPRGGRRVPEGFWLGGGLRPGRVGRWVSAGRAHQKTRCGLPVSPGQPPRRHAAWASRGCRLCGASSAGQCGAGIRLWICVPPPLFLPSLPLSPLPSPSLPLPSLPLPVALSFPLTRSAEAWGRNWATHSGNFTVCRLTDTLRFLLNTILELFVYLSFFNIIIV